MLADPRWRCTESLKVHFCLWIFQYLGKNWGIVVLNLPKTAVLQVPSGKLLSYKRWKHLISIMSSKACTVWQSWEHKLQQTGSWLLESSCEGMWMRWEHENTQIDGVSNWESKREEQSEKPSLLNELGYRSLCLQHCAASCSAPGSGQALFGPEQEERP